MKQFSKGFAFFINLANYAAGISVMLILLLKRDFTSILYINGMTTNESLFFNMIMFVTGLALAGIVLYLIVKENKKLNQVIEFPIIFEVLPVIVSIIGIVYALRADTSREKIFVIAASVAYALLSLAVIYTGAAIFQIFPKDKE